MTKLRTTAAIAIAVFLGLSAAVGAQTAVGYYARYREQAAASVTTPPTGFQNVYVSSSDHKVYRKDSTGTSTEVGGGGGGTIGGSIASTQIAVGSGANTVGGSSSLTYTGGVLALPTSGDSLDLGSGQVTLQNAPGAGWAGLLSGYAQLRLNVSGSVFLGGGATDITPLAAATLGQASLPFTTGYVGASGSLPTCDSTTRGGYRTVFAASLSADTLQVCMKNAADVYSWQTIFTAL